MKQSTYDQIRNIGTPFKVIKTPTDRIELYWTKGGIYGAQVLVCVFNPHKDSMYYKTGGCGYCKESDATTRVFRWLGYSPRGLKDTIERHCHDTICFSHRVGGNFYRVYKKDILKLKVK